MRRLIAEIQLTSSMLELVIRSPRAICTSSFVPAEIDASDLCQFLISSHVFTRLSPACLFSFIDWNAVTSFDSWCFSLLRMCYSFSVNYVSYSIAIHSKCCIFCAFVFLLKLFWKRGMITNCMVVLVWKRVCRFQNQVQQPGHRSEEYVTCTSYIIEPNLIHTFEWGVE